MRDGTYRDTAHPLSRETRQKIKAKVLEAWREEPGKARETMRDAANERGREDNRQQAWACTA
jgi:DNA-binding cell septation regulator SpoVG